MAEASPLSAASGGLRLAVRVVPKAQRSRIVGLVAAIAGETGSLRRRIEALWA
jgi:hypothetical protein